MRRRGLVHLALFLATLGTTWLVGIAHYQAFLGGLSGSVPDVAWTSGGWYAGAVLGILGAHEFGHYFMCRRYGVDATLPYFIPAPTLAGTFGAVIRIRDGFPTRAALFDIGVAGPIAGFVTLVPVLLVGLSWSSVVRVPDDFEGMLLGTPLAFDLAARLFFPDVPDGSSLNIHPLVFAAWFGMLATALNLLPFGQLDGGHLMYALIGRRAVWVSYATVLTAIGLTIYSMSWAVLTVMMLVMMLIFGTRHPTVWNEYDALDGKRIAVFVLALALLALCFTSAPVELITGTG
ncbi:MAG: site-2 protease family protein [Acidobacteriota bacterium]|nr:site-2 protease family protein [Acidobacteriota bacterium]